MFKVQIKNSFREMLAHLDVYFLEHVDIRKTPYSNINFPKSTLTSLRENTFSGTETTIESKLVDKAEGRKILYHLCVTEECKEYILL